MRHAPLAPHRWTSPISLTLAIGFALLGGGACGTPDTETSVYLEIYDGTVVSAATDVNLEVFDLAKGDKIATLRRPAAAQTGTATPLGSVVILAGASAGVGTLHIEGQRLNGGAVLSDGNVDVPLVPNRQVSARLMLGRVGGSGDAGGADTGSSADSGPPTDGGSPPADAGGGAGGTSGTGGNSGTGGSSGTSANGDSCRSAGACRSGFCSDGVCCDSDCGALCHGCNLSGSRGICKAFAAGSQCVAATCAGAASLTPARTCDGNGNCLAAGATQSCGQYRCDTNTNACLRSCASSASCVSSARCFNNRCN